MFYALGGVGAISLRSLWRHPEFVKLWAGETVSRFGSEISQLAMPLTAALVLNASPSQMGLLGAFEFAPFLLLSLVAPLGGELGEAVGVWPTIMVMAVCSLLPLLWVLFSPVRTLRAQPAPA